MSKYTYDRDKAKQWIHQGGRTSEMGRSSIQIECPFCEETFTAYIWSICGGGKKCPNCGAIHTSYGMGSSTQGQQALEGEAYPVVKS